MVENSIHLNHSVIRQYKMYNVHVKSALLKGILTGNILFLSNLGLSHILRPIC